MNRLVKAYLLAVLLIGACSRDWNPPPPIPTVKSVLPGQGFMGDPVVVEGANFDSRAENNLVFFGTESARILSASPDALTVSVPELEATDQVYVKVSTSYGQATSPGPFRYLGPGHPRGDRLERMIRIEWAPSAVAPVATFSDPQLEPSMIAASTTGRVVSILGTRSGSHFDYGVQDQPISAAMDHLLSKVYVTTVRVVPGQDTLLESQLRVLRLVPGQVFPELNADPIDPIFDIAGERFQPGLVWTYCKADPQDALCNEVGVVLSDLLRPALILINAHTDLSEQIIRVDDGSCPQSPILPTAIADLAHHPDLGSFFVLLQESSEIWSVPDTGIGCPKRLWPDGTEPRIWNFAALSLRRHRQIGLPDEFFLFAADAADMNVVKFQLVRDPFDGSLRLQDTQCRAPIWGRPYAMHTANLPPGGAGTLTKYRLYVATENGIVVLEPNERVTCEPQEQIPAVGRLPLSACRGGVQSLASINYPLAGNPDSRPDELVFADTVRDLLRIYPVGAEWTNAREISLGVTTPQVATSRFSDTLYLTDPFANVVRLIDQNSGIQSDQFPIFNETSFGTSEIACLDLAGADILLIPLIPNQIVADEEQPPFDRIIVRRAAAEKDIRQWVDAGYGYADGQQVHQFDLEVGEMFHQMLPAVKTRALYLVRYGRGIRPGRVWALGLSAESNTAGGIITKKDALGLGPVYGFIDLTLESNVEIVRLSMKEDALVTFGRRPNLAPQVEVIPLADPDSAFSVPVGGQLAYLIGDVAITTPEAGTLYLALPELGQVATLGLGLPAQPHFIQTTGVPTRLWISPDGRRLFVTHHGEGKLSIIDIDCGELPGCERVLRNIFLEDYPSGAAFHPSGKSAFVTHTQSNIISVIE